MSLICIDSVGYMPPLSKKMLNKFHGTVGYLEKIYSTRNGLTMRLSAIYSELNVYTNNNKQLLRDFLKRGLFPKIRKLSERKNEA